MQHVHLRRWWGRQIDGAQGDVKLSPCQKTQGLMNFKAERSETGGCGGRGGRGQEQSGKNMIGFFVHH